MTTTGIRRPHAAYLSDALLIGTAIFGALAIIFAPYLFGDRSLLSSSAEVPSLYVNGAAPDAHSSHLRSLDPAAAGWQLEPWLQIEHRILVDEHRPPFWDPYNGYGTPLAAAMQPQPFYPLAAALALHPTPRTYAWFVVARLFVAGWFGALFVRLFAGKSAALVAGLGTAFAGYYLLYYDITHLSVDVELPMLLWATELVVRRPRPIRCAALAIAGGLTYLGGMPETALLTLATAAVYAVVRIRARRRNTASVVTALLSAHVLGILVGAVALIPFLEFERRSFNLHDTALGIGIPGTAADGGWQQGVLSELAPLALGFPWKNIVSPGLFFTGARGFFGCVVCLLAVIALFAAIRRESTKMPVFAFWLLAAFCLLKRYGNPLVQWVGSVPLFDLIHYPKYIELLLGVAMPILAGFGVAALREGRVRSSTVIASAAAVLAALTFLDGTTRADIAPGPDAWLNGAALCTAVIAFLVAGGLALLAASGSPRRRQVACLAIAPALFLELAAGYAVPQFWNDSPPASENPYAGAPYIAFLRRHVDVTRERVFGVSGVLFPDWPGAFGLADPRSLNALYAREFLPFVDAFVTKTPPTTDDQFDRFVATRPIVMGDRLVRRLLALSSVGWILSPNEIASSEPSGGSFLSAMWQQTEHAIPAASAAAVHVTSTTLAGVPEDVLFEHPPFSDVRFETTIPRTAPFVDADIGLHPASYAHSVCGGPVTFTVSAERAGAVVASASRTIDPKHVLAQRRWMPFRLDLTRFAGQVVALRFETSAIDTCSAWAVWGSPRFDASNDIVPLRRRPTLFKEAFRAPGIFIYRVPSALSRLSMFHRAAVAADRATALGLLADTRFDALHTAVVERDVPAMQLPRGPEHVAVVHESSEEVLAVVDATASGMLVQNDTFYPGWEAIVDGRPVPIVRVDTLFRGIPIAAGHHAVTIRYASRSVRLGLATSAAGFVAVCILAFVKRRRKAT